MLNRSASLAMSTSVLKALPGKLDIKRHSPSILSDFIWDFGKITFPSHLEKYIIKIGKISTKIHEVGKIEAIFGLGMTPI